MRLSEHPHPDHVIVHVSDTHLAVVDAPTASQNSAARLRTLMSRLVETGLRPEAIIVTGDVADRGEPEAYSTVRGLVEPAAEALGARVIWVMGNHDDRAAFRSGLLDEPAATTEVDRVEWLGGLRIIVLDTTVPGRHWGEITPDQLAWLADVLAEPAPEGTVLALHHPPVPVCRTWPSAWNCVTSTCCAQCWRAPTSGRSWVATCTTPPSPPSPASRSRWHRPPATPRTCSCPTGGPPVATRPRASTWSVSTRTPSSIR